MTDGNAKSDLEHASERAVRASTKSTGILARLMAKATSKARKYYQKHFSSSLRVLRISLFTALISARSCFIACCVWNISSK